MQRNKIMSYLSERAYNADLIKRSAEELIDMLKADHPTKYEYIHMIIRAKYLLDTADSVYDMEVARIILNQIRDAFCKDFPEDYNEWWVSTNGS